VYNLFEGRRIAEQEIHILLAKVDTQLCVKVVITLIIYFYLLTVHPNAVDETTTNLIRVKYPFSYVFEFRTCYKK